MLKEIGQFIFVLIYKDKIIEMIEMGMKRLQDAIVLYYER